MQRAVQTGKIWCYRPAGKGRCELCGRNALLLQIWQGKLKFTRCQDCLTKLALLFRNAKFILVTKHGEIELDPAKELFRNLHRCEFCREQGKAVFFGSKADLEKHVQRVHSRGRGEGNNV